MSGVIDPEAAKPATVQTFEFSDRNPVVAKWGEGGGQIPTPGAAGERVTPEGAAVPEDAGLKY
jgi:hypothetical protein